MPQQFFNYDYLKTLAGATAATLLITECIKRIPFLKNVNTRIIAAVVSLFVVFFVQYITEEFLVEDIFLYVLNAMLVAFASIGSWHTISGK
jgi:hypothetical protein